MALLQDSTGYYLEPSTGQYYTPYTSQASSLYSMFNRPFGMANQNIGLGGMASGGRYNDRAGGIVYDSLAMPEGLMNFDGKQYVPFSGNAAGISQGKRSVVDALVGGRQPYQYNVPSLASMFPSLQGQMQAPAPQGNAGANRFLGGLLGSMPTPVSSTTTQAPSTSGAGRFL